MQVTEQFLTAWAAAEPAGGTGAPEPGSPSAALPPARWGSPCRSRRGLPATAHATAPTRTSAPKRCVGPRSVRTPRSDRAPTAAAATRATRSRSHSRHPCPGQQRRPSAVGRHPHELHRRHPRTPHPPPAPAAASRKDTAARHERPGRPDSLGYRQRGPGCRATGDAGRPVPAVSPIAPAPSAEPVTPGRGHGAAGHRRAA